MNPDLVSKRSKIIWEFTIWEHKALSVLLMSQKQQEKLGKFHCDMFIFKLLLVKWQFLFQNTLQ